MSFSMNVKAELLEDKGGNACCMSAELSAILHTAGSININKEGLYAEITTENASLAGRILYLYKKLYNINAAISRKKSSFSKRELYSIKADEKAEIILRELGIIEFDENNLRQIVSGADGYITEQQCCKKSYIKGAFLAGGSITVPKSQKSGYFLNIVFSNIKMAEDVSAYIKSFNINSKTAQRKNKYIVYLKEAESIADFLALLGASKSVLILQDLILKREIKNYTNRQTNCIFANINKSVSAAIRQTEAINIIDEHIGLDSLPKPLKKIALLRREHPDASLESIAQLSDEKLTKSGINHRMRKIIDIAENIAKNAEL